MSHAGPMVGPACLLVATNNRHKAQEVAEILAPLGLTVRTPLDVGYVAQVDETETTFVGNALLKSRAGFAATGQWCLADDSGIEAAALGGAPGVYSARYAGVHGDDAANNRQLVAALTGHRDRRVRYVCAIAVTGPGPQGTVIEQTFLGYFPGQHVAEPQGEGGFGYDAHVFIPELGRTVAQLTSAEKHARSHRGHALRACAAWFATLERGL